MQGGVWIKHTKSHMGTLTQRVAGAPPPGRPPTRRRLVSPSPPSLFTISRLGSLFYDHHNHHRCSSIIPERPVQSPAQPPAAAARTPSHKHTRLAVHRPAGTPGPQSQSRSSSRRHTQFTQPQSRQSSRRHTHPAHTVSPSRRHTPGSQPVSQFIVSRSAPAIRPAPRSQPVSQFNS